MSNQKKREERKRDAEREEKRIKLTHTFQGPLSQDKKTQTT